MADHADDDSGDGIFIYRGGRAPQHITHALIDTSVDEIEDNAFKNCQNLLQVDTHDGIRKVGKDAFCQCKSLRGINLKSAVEIGYCAFFNCENLGSVEFGDRLETIGGFAFTRCSSLQHHKIRTVTAIESAAFHMCHRLTDVELSEGLETMGTSAFHFCSRLQRIAIPLKRDLFQYDDFEEAYTQFYNCAQLNTVDLIGGIHKTVASLHMENWRTEMTAEINRINEVLPNTPCTGKANEIRQWMEVVMDKMDHYKAEHHRYVKEGVTLLELALWKAKLVETEDSSAERQLEKAKVDSESAREERRITCGANIVIKNVLPFLKLE